MQQDIAIIKEKIMWMESYLMGEKLMEQEYYYNPQTNETFAKDSNTKIAVPENFSKVDKSIYDSFVSKGAKGYGNIMLCQMEEIFHYLHLNLNKD